MKNVEAAARLGINSVLFDTVEKTSRVESRFDIPVPSYGRCRQSSSQYSSINRRPEQMESVDAATQLPTGTRERVRNLSEIFLIHGLIIATWASRIPAFQAYSTFLPPFWAGR